MILGSSLEHSNIRPWLYTHNYETLAPDIGATFQPERVCKDALQKFTNSAGDEYDDRRAAIGTAIRLPRISIQSKLVTSVDNSNPTTCPRHPKRERRIHATPAPVANLTRHDRRDPSNIDLRG